MSIFSRFIKSKPSNEVQETPNTETKNVPDVCSVLCTLEEEHQRGLATQYSYADACHSSFDQWIKQQLSGKTENASIEDYADWLESHMLAKWCRPIYCEKTRFPANTRFLKLTEDIEMPHLSDSDLAHFLWSYCVHKNYTDKYSKKSEILHYAEIINNCEKTFSTFLFIPKGVKCSGFVRHLVTALDVNDGTKQAFFEPFTTGAINKIICDRHKGNV